MTLTHANLIQSNWPGGAEVFAFHETNAEQPVQTQLFVSNHVISSNMAKRVWCPHDSPLEGQSPWDSALLTPGSTRSSLFYFILWPNEGNTNTGSQAPSSELWTALLGQSSQGLVLLSIC